MDEVEVCLYSLVCRVMVICCGIGRLAWLDIRCTICSHGRLPMSEVDLLDSRRRKKTAGCINLFIVPSSIHRWQITAFNQDTNIQHDLDSYFPITSPKILTMTMAEEKFFSLTRRWLLTEAQWLNWKSPSSLSITGIKYMHKTSRRGKGGKRVGGVSVHLHWQWPLPLPLPFLTEKEDIIIPEAQLDPLLCCDVESEHRSKHHIVRHS